MHETSDFETYGKGHRTFDCPWCGAISGIDPSHLGEHFDCPECHKRTKLTPDNTRQGHLTEAPEDAPAHEEQAKAKTGKKPLHEVSELEAYGRGARTFDCPWCGAIASIDPGHLGEHFDCPECHKRTKLTPDNTRSTPPTEPPPDAPHHEESKAWNVRMVLLGLGLIAVVAVVVAIALGSGGSPSDEGDTGPDGDGTERAGLPSSEEPAAGQPAAGQPAAGQPTSGEPTTSPEGGPEETTPPDEGTPEETPPEEAPPEEVEPPDPVDLARTRLEEAVAQREAWEASHPEEMKVIRLRKLGNDMRATLQAELEKLGDGDVTVQQARAFNQAIREYVKADPERIALASYLVRHLARDGVKPAGVETWDDLNFYAPRIRDTFLEVCGAWGGPEIEAYTKLQAQEKAARVALDSLREGE